MNDKLNLHYYDGKLIVSDFLSDEIKRVSEINNEKKIEAFSLLRKSLSPNVLPSYDAIVREFTISGRSNNRNYDSSNKLYACDLLYLCYEGICEKKNMILLDELIVQLIDMSSGLCNPGRTTRLYQILLSFE